MLFLRSWIEEYIDLSKFTNQDLAKEITAFSMEVEEVKEVKDIYNGLVVIGKILDPKPVEGSNKLKVFDVDLGDRKIQIVSAAPNVVAGNLVAVALVGAKLPNGITIAERKMMGQATQGMCLGKSELCLEEGYSSGLWEIDQEFKAQSSKLKVGEILGRSVCEVFPQYFPAETVFDIKVLPNSMGILSNHLGLAYELALVLKDFSLLKPLAKQFLDFKETVQLTQKVINLDLGQTEISFEDKVQYSRYFSLHQLTLAKEFHLPTQIAMRLFLIEQNSVSPIVDISNYLIYDIGQPTHFFSKAKLESLSEQPKTELVIDVTNKSTEFTGLGQLKNTVLGDGVTAIFANQTPIILPGISGGQSTMVEAGETEIYMELANFDPEQVAKNSFKLGFNRSAATRVFAGNVPSIKLLITLIRLHQIFGDTTSLKTLILSSQTNSKLNFDQFCDLLEADFKEQVKLDLDYFEDRIQCDYSVEVLAQTLKNLGKVEHLKENKYNFTPNKLYTAYEVKEDILSDLARLNNLLKIEAKSVKITVSPEIDKVYKPILQLKQFVADLGFTETINRPFISPEVLNNLPQTQAQSLLILNPIRSQEPYNRTGLIESLLQITRKNLDAGQNQINVFELNKIYLRSKNTKNTKAHQITTQIQEKVLLGILSTELNMQDLATIMHQILFKIKQNIHEFHGFKDDLALNGYIGNNDEVELKIYQLNNSAKKKFGISLSKNISYLEFDLTNWSRQINSFEQYREDREFPDLKRTLSFFVPHSLSFASVKSVIANLEVIQKHEFEVVVEGLERISGAEVEDLEDQIFTPDILNFTLKLNHPSRTITGEEGLEVEESILSALQANYSSKIARR